MRGQTLVMMTLMALLLTLMVMMTISIGTKAKEKMEVQTMSDSAAYSQAVVTARTFNSISLLNRVGVAYVVGALAIQSLVSWSTYVLSVLMDIGYANDDWAAQFLPVFKITPACYSGPFCACATAGLAPISEPSRRGSTPSMSGSRSA